MSMGNYRFPYVCLVLRSDDGSNTKKPQINRKSKTCCL